MAIPRLETVANYILLQNDPPEEATPMVSRILRVVGDYQRYFKNDRGTAIKRLDDPARYDPAIVASLSSAISETSGNIDVRVDELSEGMLLADNVLDDAGRLLIAGGAEVHQAMIQKLLMLQSSAAV